jgi:LemA protein
MSHEIIPNDRVVAKSPRVVRAQAAARTSPDRYSVRGAGRGILLLVLGIVVVLGVVFVGSYNGLVTKKEKVAAAWSQIDNEYKRRADLVPNLVATVQGAADFEKSTIIAVTEARASVGRAQLPTEMPTDEKQLAAYIAAQQGLGAALSRLMVVAEAYPELKATQNFRDLQVQLEGTENRIAVARTDYIEAVRDYNTAISKVPGSLVAGFGGMKPAAQLTIPEAERTAPKVDFGGKK